MKTLNSKIIIFLTLFLLSVSLNKANAQNILLNDPQVLTISGPGFFPFDTIGNNTLQEAFPQSSELTAEISNVLGGAFDIAPAKDFAEIGEKQRITGNTIVMLDFSPASSSNFQGQFGISFVPISGPVTFNITIFPPEINSSTSSSTSSSSSTGGADLTPDSIGVFTGFLSDSIANSISNDNNNLECMSSPTGIDSTALSSTGLTLINSSIGLNTVDSSRLNAMFLVSSEEENSLVLSTGSKKKIKGTYIQDLINSTDKRIIFVTAIYPTLLESPFTSRVDLKNNIDVSVKNQIDPALAAVQHAIISATMPWQLSNNGGFFITQGGGCVAPYCVIVEQGMIVIDPDGACTPDKLNKRKAKYPVVNPSKFFDPFPAAQSTIGIPVSSIVDPKHPNVSSSVNTQSGYLIFQPVPPGVKFKQELKLEIKK